MSEGTETTGGNEIVPADLRSEGRAGMHRDVAIPSEEACDVRTVAREMARAHREHLAWVEEAYSLKPGEALAQHKESAGEDWRKTSLGIEPDQITWWNLSFLTEDGDEELALELWAKCKLAALEELRSGHRAARLMEPSGKGSPLDRARFLVLRSEFRRDWKPKRGMESSLVDQLAEFQTLYERAMETYVHRISYRGVGNTTEEKRRLKEYGSWLTPRVTEQEAEDAALQTLDRLQRAFLRTLRALRDLRRMSPPVVVQNAGQVNVGQQQVNVNGTTVNGTP